MASSKTGNLNVPDISYEDGVSTIRVNTIDKKGHILTDKPDSLKYSRPATTVGENKPAVTIKQVKPEIIAKHTNTKGDIIEPVLVRERPDGEEIVTTKPMYAYEKHHPPIQSSDTNLSKPELSSISSIRTSSNPAPVHTPAPDPPAATAAPPAPPPPPSSSLSNPDPVTSNLNKTSNNSVRELSSNFTKEEGKSSSGTAVFSAKKSQGIPVIVSEEADIYRPDRFDDDNNNRRGSDLVASTSSILKKSGQRKSKPQQNIRWNESVTVNEEDRKTPTKTELQKEDHQFNPINDPRDESCYRRDIPPDSEIGSVIGSTLDREDNGSVLSPNGSILQRQTSSSPPSSPSRYVPPYGAEHFRYEESIRRDSDNKWCMRIAIIVLIFFVTFALIGVIVLGLLYAWSQRTDWNAETVDYRERLNLKAPDEATGNLFPRAWFSNVPGSPAYFLVVSSDTMRNQRPNSKRYMTWHSGKSMRVQITDIASGTPQQSVILGDPLEHDGALLVLRMDVQYSYSASIVGKEEYALISFVSAVDQDLSWTSEFR